MFGRRKDEDPFAALKDGGTYQSPSTPAALVTRQPPPRRASGYGLGSGGGNAAVWRLLIVVFVIAAALIPLLTLGHTLHSIKIPSFNYGSGNSSGAGGGVTPTAPSHTSYLSSAGLRVGLAGIERIAPHSRLALLLLGRSAHRGTHNR